jgi:hypothetical protein
MDHTEVIDLLETGELFEVLEHDHPTYGWYLAFDDEPSHAHSDALDGLDADLSELAGVDMAVRGSRVVLVAAVEPTDATVGARLAAFLDGWFRVRFGRQPIALRETTAMRVPSCPSLHDGGQRC